MASSGNTVLVYLWVITGVCLLAHFSGEIAEYVPNAMKALSLWRGFIVGWLLQAAFAYTAIYFVVLVSSNRLELRKPFAIEEPPKKRVSFVVPDVQLWLDDRGYDTVH